MIKFLLMCVIVFIVVDLFVRFVVEPLIRSSNKKDRQVKSSAIKFDPSFRLATETMYDGGKPFKNEEIESTEKEENISNKTAE